MDRFMKPSASHKSLCLVLSWSLLVFSFPAKVAAQGNVTVAVLDLEGRGISALEAQSLTDRMRSELVNTAAVTVAERGQMQEVLEEQGFQQTGCTSAECAVEVGKLLGVTNMVTGSIGKVGQSYTIDLRMFSVESGAITKSVNRTYRGEVDGLITEIERMAWSLVDMAPPSGRIPGEKPPVAAEVTPPPPSEGPRDKFIAYTDPPTPIGGFETIQKNIRYPEIARDAGIEGVVFIQAFIDSTGGATDMRILKGIPNSGLDEAAMDAIKKTRWIPAKQGDRARGVWISIPVSFKLREGPW